MKIDKSILFFGRHRNLYSSLIYKKLKSIFKTVDVFWSKTYSEKIENKKYKKKYDYIFCFRSYLILNKKIISKAKIAAINFHPATPKYRGVGCANYALYNNSKYYGVTTHLIDNKIDNGAILEVKKFKINKSWNLVNLLTKTHDVQYKQALKFIKKFSKNENFLIKMKNKNTLWSKKLGTKKKLDDFYCISKNITKKKLNMIIKSTVFGKFKPYIKIHGRVFKLDN